MNDETTQLHSYLVEIASRSQVGEILWTQPNSSSFQWTDGKFTTLIQKASTPRLRIGATLDRSDEVNYLFQVVDRTTRQAVVSLSSKDRPEFARVLAEIYRGAERGMDVGAVNVLRTLLEK